MYGLILLVMITCVEALLQKTAGLFEMMSFLANQTSELQMEVQCNTWEFEQFECRQCVIIKTYKSLFKY